MTWSFCKELCIKVKEDDCNQSPPTIPISTHVALGIKSNLLLMTCHVLVEPPNGSSMEARAILDSSSLASHVLKGWPEIFISLKVPQSQVLLVSPTVSPLSQLPIARSYHYIHQPGSLMSLLLSSFV